MDVGLLAEDRGGSGGRGQADDLTAVWVQAEVRACMAVVFPAPAGAIASCSRAPEVHMERTSAA